MWALRWAWHEQRPGSDQGMRLETCAVWINPAGKKPPQNQTRGTSRFSISCHGGVRDGEETVTALFTLQVSTGLGETHRFCSIKVRDAPVLPQLQ